MNDFGYVLRNRVSNRKFKSDFVEEALVAKLIKSGEEAPVAKGLYGDYLFTVVNGNKALEFNKEIINVSQRNVFYNAPLIILVSTKNTANPELSFQDAGCILENMHLEATNLGLGSVYIYSGAKIMRSYVELYKFVSLPEEYTPLAALAIGYVSEEDKVDGKTHEIKVMEVK
jgi:nitroreductase